MRLDGSRGKKKFGVSLCEPKVFRKQICCIEESACDTVGLFGAPADIRRPQQRFGARGIVPPFDTPLPVSDNWNFHAQLSVSIGPVRTPING